MARDLLRPRWLLLHVAVVGLVGALVALGVWQLGRHQERQAFNALVAERMALPPAPLDELVAAGRDAAIYRRATAAGVFRPEHELLLTGRTAIDGQPGHNVLTPLDVGGSVVLVDRGWVPFQLDTPPVTEAAPPDGEVTVVGMLLPTEPAGRLGPRLPPEGRLQRVTRVDLERLAGQLPGTAVPLWLRLDQQAPPQRGPLPHPTPPPTLEAGNHLPYAVQWFLFAAIAAAGYPLLLRRHRGVPSALGEVSGATGSGGTTRSSALPPPRARGQRRRAGSGDRPPRGRR